MLLESARLSGGSNGVVASQGVDVNPNLITVRLPRRVIAITRRVARKVVTVRTVFTIVRLITTIVRIPTAMRHRPPSSRPAPTRIISVGASRISVVRSIDSVGKNGNCLTHLVKGVEDRACGAW